MRKSRVRRFAALGALASVFMFSTLVVGVQPASALVLPSAVSLTTGSNPAAPGETVTYNAVVTVLGTNLGPITPTGTVKFTVGSASKTVALGSCVALIQQCTASATLAVPATAGTYTATAQYVPSSLAALTTKGSTGSVNQHVAAPKTCATDAPCTHAVTSTDGSARVRIDTPSLEVGGYEYQIQISFTDADLSCGAHGADTGVFDTTAPVDVLEGDPDKHTHTKGQGHSHPGHPDGTVPSNPVKDVTYDIYGSFAEAMNASGNETVCWAADSPFTTASGQPAPLQGGLYVGILPQCGDGVARPCQDGGAQFFAAGPESQALRRVVVKAPAGDPRLK